MSVTGEQLLEWVEGRGGTIPSSKVKFVEFLDMSGKDKGGGEATIAPPSSPHCSAALEHHPFETTGRSSQTFRGNGIVP